MTPKQQRFVAEYLIDLNATAAAERAGYKHPNKQGPALLVNLGIAAAIADAMKDRAERTEITQDMVLRELALLGFANPGDYFDWGPMGVTLKAKDDLTLDQQKAVAEVSETKTEKGGTIRLKLCDKRAALVDVGRHLGMFKELHEHTGKDGGPIEYAELTDAERRHRIDKLYDAARARRDGQASKGGRADLGHPGGTTNGSA